MLSSFDLLSNVSRALCCKASLSLHRVDLKDAIPSLSQRKLLNKSGGIL